MYFSLEIDSNNAVMHSQEDVIAALNELILQLSKQDLPEGGTIGAVKDANGNTVGNWFLKK